MEPIKREQLLSIPEAGKMLAVSTRQVWRLIGDGKLAKPIRLGPKSTRVRLSDVVAYIERMAASQGAK